MFKRNLFKRFLPIALSVAMTVQSLPVTSYAAEGTTEPETAVEQTTDEVVDDDAGDKETGSSEAVDGQNEGENEESKPTETQATVEETKPDETQTAEENKDAGETQTEETKAAEAETEEAVEEAADNAEAALDTKIVVNESNLKYWATNSNYGNNLSYNDIDKVISKSYSGANVFDTFVNNYIKTGNYNILSVEVDGVANTVLKKNLTFKWQQKNAEGQFVDMAAGVTPFEAGNYQLVISLAATDGVCTAAETTISFEIKKTELTVDLSGVKKPEIGTKIADFVAAFKEDYVLKDSSGELNKEVYVKSISVVVKDAVSGTEITDADAVFEKDKDYSYVITVELNDTNYVVEDKGEIDIVLQGDVKTDMKVTLLKNVEYTYGDEVKLPTVGTDYTVEVTYKDEDKKDVTLENPTITATWLDADGNELVSADGKEVVPKDAGVYTVLLTYEDETGRYASCESKDLTVKINPVSVYVKPSLSTSQYTAEMTEKDILKNVTYEILKSSDNAATSVDKKTFWGVSYSDDTKTQYYEPVFKLQVAKAKLDKDEKPVKDKDGNIEYGAYTDNNGAALISGDAAKYRVVFEGKKSVYTGSGAGTPIDLNKGTNSTDPNYAVDVTEPTITKNVVDISVIEAATLTIDVSAYDSDAKEKVYDGKAFYEKRADYKKAKIEGGKADDLSYNWYEGHTEQVVDADGNVTTKYVWNATPTFDFNYTDIKGEHNAISPVEAGLYKLEISYKDPTGKNAAKPVELIYTIHEQKVKAEIATGTDVEKFTTYSGVTTADFIDSIEDTMAKSVKIAVNNDLSNLGDELDWWEYDKDYKFAWFIERQDQIDNTKWVPVVLDDGDGGSEAFIENIQYRLCVGVIENIDNYQGRDTDVKEDTPYGGFYISNYINIDVKKMGETPLDIVVDQDKLGNLTKKYDGTPFAVPADAVSVVNARTGNVITDVELEYAWFDNTKGKYVDEAVNGGTYELYVTFEGNDTYAPLNYKQVGDANTKFIITKREISVQPVLVDEIKAGTYSSFSSVVEDDNKGTYLLNFSGDILESESQDFVYGTWTEDDVSYIGYKAVISSGGIVKTHDENTVPDSVLKAGIQYYAVPNVSLSTPYSRNYALTQVPAEFTPVRDSALVSKATYNGIPATSLKDYIGNEKDSEVITHRITPREGIAFTTGVRLPDVEETLEGNFFVFQIQAPTEFYAYGYRENYVTNSLKPVYENSIRNAGGYPLNYNEATGTVKVAFKTEGKNEKYNFEIRWEDEYIEKFTVDFTGAVLEADLTKAVAPKSIAFNSPATKMAVGEKQQLDVKVTKNKLDDIICLKYVSDNAKVLSVSESGAVVAAAVGTATVKAIPCYIDKDGKKQEIAGAKQASVKITVVDVTAPKIKSVTALDTTATVTYPALSDGYRREIYVLEGSVKEDAFKTAIGKLTNGNWKEAGFAIAPKYTESIDSETNIATVSLSGLGANKQYTVYVRNVSGTRTLADGAKVELSAKGAVKSFKTTLSQVEYLEIGFDDEKYWDDEDEEYVVDITEKKVPSITTGWFKEVAQNSNADADDHIEYVLPLDKRLSPNPTQYYAQPKLSYFVTSGTYYYDEPTGYYTLKISDKDGDRYYYPSPIAKVDKKGALTLSGVGYVYLWVVDSVTGESACVCLHVTATATKMTLAKSAKVRVGEQVRLGKYTTYYNAKNQKLNGYSSSLVITDISGDTDAFVVNGNVITAKEAKKSITITVTDPSIKDSKGTIKITSKDIEAVKNLKVSEVVDKYATVSFTYPDSAFEWSDDSDTEKSSQLYFRIQVIDGAKKIVSDNYYHMYDLHYRYSKGTYTFAKSISGLTRKSNYTVTVTAGYLDQSSKAASKSFKTTDIPAAYQYEYQDEFRNNNETPFFHPYGTDEYKTDDGGIGIEIGDYCGLYNYPTLTSNNTYTLIAWPENIEAKNRLSDTLTWKSTDTKVATVKANAGSYTATLKTLKKGTTKIEVSSKITKRIIARWTVIVNAVGEAQYYYGDFEPDEGDEIVGGIEYGDIELLTCDNPVKVKLATGEGKIAKFVAPAYGKYDFSATGLGMLVYNYDNEGNINWFEDTFVYSCDDIVLQKGETRYFAVGNTYDDAKDVTISASGTIYGTLTMDEYTSKGEYVVFTAPEDNYYTVVDSKTKTIVNTIGGLKTGKTSAPLWLNKGTYTVSKRVCAPLTVDGLKEQEVKARETNWYVFTAPTGMDYTFAATKGTVSVYSDIKNASSESSATVSVEKDDKVYIAVANTETADIKTDITVTSEAQISNAIDTDPAKTTTTPVAITKAGETYYVQMTIPADGWYKIKTTATTATAQNNTGAAALTAATPTVTVSLADDTKGTDSKNIGTYYEAEFKKGDVVYVGVSSDTANTAATLAVNKIGVTTVTEGKNTATLSSDFSYYKFTAKSEGEYTFATTVTNRTEGTTPGATMVVYKGEKTISATTTLKTGEIVYLKVNTNATDGKSDSAEIKVSKLEAESFTTEWTKDFAKDDTNWIQFKAPADALYSFTTQTTQKVAGTGSVTATQTTTLGGSGMTVTTPATKYYKAGEGFYLKLVADEAVTYKITAVPVTPEKVTNSAVTIPKKSEKWFSFTAPATAKYSVKLTGDDLTNIAVARYDLIHNTNQGFENEKTLTAGQTVYYKITNDNDADKSVTLNISQIEAAALDTTEAGSSKKATLANNESVWYSFKAPAGGRYSFKASATAETGKTARAAVEYFTSMTGGTKTGVGNPEDAVFLKANETVYVKVTATTDAATTEVTTSVKAIVPVDISTSDVTKPAEKTETNIAANSVQWYSIKGEGTYTIKISDVTEGGNYEAYGVWNSSTYFHNCNTEVTLDADDVYTIAVKANTDKLGYKITVTKRDIKEVSLTTPVAGSLKTGEDLYVSFKVPEDGRYAIRLDGLQDVNASIRCTSNNIRDNSSANAYYDFVADMNDVIIFKVNVTSAESVNFSVKAEVVSPTDISASGAAEISKDAADRQISWYAYTAKEDGKYLVKTDASANVAYYYSLTDTVHDADASGEQILSKGKTYYYAVWCDTKPAANVNFSIKKVVANELKIADNGTEGSLTVDVTKVAPNEKYYISFTAPQDGRYVFSYATEGGYTPTEYVYEDIDSFDYGMPGRPNNYEKVLKKGQNILFATSYTGAQEKNYTIKVVWNKPVQVTDNAEITLAAGEKKYVAFTATKSCEAKVTLTPVDSTGFYYTDNMSNSITGYYYYYYASNERTVSDKISAGATKYVGIQNSGSTPIKVKVKYEEGDAFTTVTTGDNEIELAAKSSKTVSFTVAEEGIYSFSHSNADDVSVDIDKDTLWFYSSTVTGVYLNKGDIVLFTVENDTDNAVKDTLTITKTDVVTTLGLDTETTLTFDKDSHYAYIKVTADKEGCYLFTFDSYSTVYKKSGVNGYSSVGGGNVVALTLNAGETVVYRVYNSTNTGSASASFSYLGRVEEVANKTDISYDITLNKGEVVYVDLSKLNGVYPFNVNSDNIVNVEYFSSLNATAESIGAGKNLSFIKVANNASFIRLTGTADNTQVTLYVGEQPEMWSYGGYDVYFDEGKTSSVYNLYCNRSAYYYFSQNSDYDYISSIDIMDDKGTVLMHIEADAFNTASRWLNAGKLYQIRVNRETAGSDGESYLYIYRYQRQNVNDELHDRYVYVAPYEQYWFGFTAPSDGTYKFYSTYDETDKLDTYAELYTSDGKFIASNDDEDDYNFAISKYLVAGEQVQLRTRDFGYGSGYYYVSIVKVEN